MADARTGTALGASASNVLRLITSRGLTLVASGAGIGVFASLVLCQTLKAQLENTSPYDPSAYLAAAALLKATTLGAILIPGLRALHISPAKTLRHE